MPYIAPEDRREFTRALAEMQDTVHRHGLSNGELNYLFTRLAMMYLHRHGETYNTLSDVVKAFECAKLEFYFRMVAPYETRKRLQNGDVYD